MTTVRNRPTQQPGRAEPKVMNGGLHYRNAPGKAFVGGISPTDVMQGAAGDCYLLSTLTVLAQSHPEVIRTAIHKSGNGYVVRFFARSGAGYKPVNVKIDGKLPERSGTIWYAHGRNTHELWPALIEKAYAKWKGGYGAIGHGGYGSAAIEAMTGKPAGFTEVEGKSPGAIADFLKRATAAKLPVVALCDDRRIPARENSTGLVGSHFYGVAGVVQKNGQTLVKLRNPWGKYEPRNKLNGANDGVFYLPLSSFMRNFRELDFQGSSLQAP